MPDPTPTPEDEALKDALDELNRMDSAEEYSVKDVDPLALPMIPSVVEQTSRRRSIEHLGEDAAIPDAAFRTLEDLYAEFKDIGGGARFLRVHRRAPATWNGLRIAGFLADLHEQISMNEFAARFGGGQYEVSVMGPVANALDDSGASRVRSLRSVRIEVPGRPIAVQVQTPQTSTAAGRRYQMEGGEQANAQVEIAKINAQQRQQERSEQERRALMDALVRAKQTPTEIFGQLDALAEKRAAEVRAGMQETVGSLKRESERLRAQLDERERAIATMRAERDESINKLRMELIEARQIAERQATEREERRVKEVKERFDEELRRVREDHAKAIQQFAAEHAALMAKAADESARERDRLRDDAMRRETQIASDAKMREEFAERAHRDRMEAMEKQFLRELDSVRLSTSQQIEAIRSTEASKTSVADKSAEIRISVLAQELSSARADGERLRSENEELRRKLLKSPVEAIQEAHQLASMTGMVRAADMMTGESKPEEEDFDWKKGLIQLAKGAVERIPETLQRIESARMQNQQVAAQQQAYAAQQQYLQAQSRAQIASGAQRQALATQQPAQYQQVRRPPPGYVPAGPRGPVMPQAPGDAPYVPPIGYAQPVQADWTQPASRQEPRQQPQAANGVAEQAQPPQSATAAEVAQPSEAQGPGSTAQEEINITPQQVQEIVDNLEAAVATGAVTPESFADAFVSKVGKEAARSIVANVTPEQLVEQVAAGKESGNTPLATMRGRQFLNKLWQETRRIAS